MDYRYILSLVISCSLSFAIDAQTGPGGVGSSTDNIGWFQSNVGVFNSAGSTMAGNGDQIHHWNDQSGNNFSVVQTDVDNRPTFNTNQINGFPAVTFDGSNDFIEGSLGGGSTDEATIITVGNFALASQPNNNYDIMYSLGSAWSTCVTLARLAGNHSGGSGANKYYSFAMANVRVGSSTVLNNSFHVFNQRFDDSAPFHNLNLDGTAQTVQDLSSAISVSEQLRFGALKNSNPTHPFNGNLAEVIVYNTFLNTTQSNIIENYLAAKYALTISNDLYAFQGTHPNEVAGIGQETATDNHTDARGSAIVRISGASDLDDGEYLIWGHDGSALAGDNGGDIPAAISGTGGQRLVRYWVADTNNGNVGTVDITFDMSTISLGPDPNDYRILTDDDGTFSNAEVNATITPVINGNLITFNNVDLYGNNNFFTIANTSDEETCIGVISLNWNQAVAWTCTNFPDSTNNAEIDDGVNITVTGTHSITDLQVNEDFGGGGGSLTLSAGATLIVKGNLTVQSGATLVADPTSTIIFRSASATTQEVDFEDGGTITFGNLRIKNPDGVRFLTADYEITGGLHLIAGEYINTTSLTFISDATTQGHIARVGTGSMSGNDFTFQRFMSGRKANWNDLSTTGMPTTVSDLDDEIFISGVPGADGFAQQSGGGAFISMWYYDTLTNNFLPVGHVNDTMPIGRGYEIWLGDNLNNWNAKAWDFNSSTMNVSETTIPLNGAGEWHLIGNPFPGFLDFAAVNADHDKINGDEFWYYDADSSAYNHRGPNAYIPPGQGFYLECANTFDFILNPTDHLKSDINTSEFFKVNSDSKEEMKIDVKGDGEEVVYGSAVYLRKQENAFSGADAYDAAPLKVPDPRAVNMWMDYSSHESMLNYFDTQEEHLEIPLVVETKTPGDFVISFKGLGHFEEYQCFNLLDEKTGEQIQILPGSSYRFSIEDESTPVHLKLLMSKEDYEDCLAPSSFGDNEIRVFSTGKQIIADFYLDRSAEADINVYNVLGEQIYQKPVNVGYSRETINLTNVQTGVYFVNIHINGQTKTEKVVLK